MIRLAGTVAVCLAIICQFCVLPAVAADGAPDGSTRTTLFGGIGESIFGGRATWLQSLPGRTDPSPYFSIVQLRQRESPRTTLVGTADLSDFPLKAKMSLPLPASDLPPLPAAPAVHLTLPARTEWDEAREQAENAKFDADLQALCLQSAWQEEQADETLRQAQEKLQQQWLSAQDALGRQHARMLVLSWPSARLLDAMRSRALNDQEQLQETASHYDELQAEVAARAERSQKKLEEMKARLKLPPRTTYDITPDGSPKELSENVSGHLSLPFATAAEVSARLTIGPADPSSSNSAFNDVVTNWDDWYARFAKIVSKPLLDEVNSHGNPEGKDTVKITVHADHSLDVQISEPGNSAFDDAVLDAYRSLDFEPALAFPVGSKRKSVTFLTDHLHQAQGPAVQVDVHQLTGDVEHEPTPN